ncbi:MAG: SpoVA/SpoVAEb family sporulation membrane protein [Oscillospiraceae bacterium]|nr:SpoVA/SpoVAEb family sporulation membrane protein [Oscillospiraceae bacterium]
MTDKQYAQLIDQYQKPSPLGKNALRAFLVGGIICAGAQLVTHGLITAGVQKDSAATVVSAGIILAAALLTGLGVFDELAKFAGAGTLVPITGFANAMVAPALEFKSEGLVTGTAVKLFTVAGPVIVYGVSASVVYGIIYWVTTLF